MNLHIEIHVASGRQDGHKHRLRSDRHGKITEKGYWEIIIGGGRGAPVDVAIEDEFASRQHVKLRVHQGNYWLIDLESSNGVTVISPDDFFKDLKFSSKALKNKKLPISPDNLFCIGRTWLKIYVPNQEEA